MTTVTALHCYARGQGLASSPAQSGWDTCVAQGQGLGDPRALPRVGEAGFLPQSHAERHPTEAGLPQR